VSPLRSSSVDVERGRKQEVAVDQKRRRRMITRARAAAVVTARVIVRVARTKMRMT
jgi:hypothetical protein